jgi:hypothetical protein
MATMLLMDVYVVADAGFETIVSSTASEQVISSTPMQGVPATIAEKHILTVAAKEPVSPPPPDEFVIPAESRELISTLEPFQDIVVLGSGQLVIGGRAYQMNTLRVLRHEYLEFIYRDFTRDIGGRYSHRQGPGIPRPGCADKAQASRIEAKPFRQGIGVCERRTVGKNLPLIEVDEGIAWQSKTERNAHRRRLVRYRYIDRRSIVGVRHRDIEVIRNRCTRWIRSRNSHGDVSNVPIGWGTAESAASGIKRQPRREWTVAGKEGRVIKDIIRIGVSERFGWKREGEECVLLRFVVLQWNSDDRRLIAAGHLDALQP